MNEEINWKNIEQNSTQALKYVYQQHRVFLNSSNKADLVKAVTQIRDNNLKQNSTQNSTNASGHSSAASSRSQSPIIPIPIRKRISQKKGNILKFLRTPNPIVLTIAFASLITCLIWMFSHIH